MDSVIMLSRKKVVHRVIDEAIFIKGNRVIHKVVKKCKW